MFKYFVTDILCVTSAISSSGEVEFLLKCAQSSDSDLLDYVEFTDRFHEPAADIGFNLAVLLTNLSEHMPNEDRCVCVCVVDYNTFY